MVEQLSRLIDADKLKDDIRYFYGEKKELIQAHSVICLINDQQTAYDVEKTCEAICDYFKGYLDKKTDVWDVLEFNADIQEIVRRGGIDG